MAAISSLSVLHLLLVQPFTIHFARAQTSTTSLPFFDILDHQPIVASVIGAQPSATTYLVACPSGGHGDDCGLASSGATLTAGASLYDFYMKEPTKATMSLHCSLTGTIAALCTLSLGGLAANDPGISTATYAGTEMEYLPVTITAGLDKLGGVLTSTSMLAPNPTSTTSTFSVTSSLRMTATPTSAMVSSSSGPTPQAATSSSWRSNVSQTASAAASTMSSGSGQCKEHRTGIFSLFVIAGMLLHLTVL